MSHTMWQAGKLTFANKRNIIEEKIEKGSGSKIEPLVDWYLTASGRKPAQENWVSLGVLDTTAEPIVPEDLRTDRVLLRLRETWQQADGQ